MDWSKERADFLSQATQGPSDEPDNELIPTKGNYTYANPELAALERGAVNVGRSILGIPAMLAGTAGATAPSVSADMAMDMDGYTPLDSSLQSGVNQALDTAHDTTAPVWNGIENNSRYLASKLPEDWHANKEVGAVRGFADTVLENAPQMALQAGLAMVNPALSAAVLAGSVGGGEYLDLRDKGVDPGTAGQASLLNAATQTPLEYIPMEKWINARRILGKHGLLKTIGVPMASEGVTEAIQEIPDEMTSYYAEHGTLDGFDYNKLGLNAAEAGAVGAVYGGLFAGINAAVHKPIEENANEPQNTADAEPSVEEPSVEEPTIEEPTVEVPDTEEPQGPSVDSTPNNNFTIADDADFDDETDDTKAAAYAVINEFKRRHPDVEITLTSGQRPPHGDGDTSDHIPGRAFDVVSPAFEGEDGKALRDEYGEIARSMGLHPLDEYDDYNEEQFARGGKNYHISVPEDWHAPQSADPASTILDAIGGQESGGDYTAENGSTGAYGKYQITDDTWNTYADEAGVGKDAERTPENQEKVAKYMMDKYYREYGTDGAIIAWYAGEGTARAFVNGELSDEALHRPQPGGPSIADYLASVKSRMKSPVGGGTTGSVVRSVDTTPTKSAEDFLKDLESSMPLDTQEHIDTANGISDVLENGTKEDWERKAREYGWNPPEEAKTATQETAQQEPVQQIPTQQAPTIQPIPKAPVLPEPKPIQRMERTKPASAPTFANSINGRAVKSSNKSENGRIKVDSSAVKNLPTYEEGRPNPDYDSTINGREELNRRMGNEYDNRNSAGNIGNGGGIYQGYSANRGELNNRMQNDYGNKVNPFIQKALQNPVLTNLVKRAYVDGDMAAMQRLEALKINPNVISAVREKVEGETNANTKKNGRVLHPTQENHNVNPKSQEGSVQKGKANESTEAEQGVTYQAPINGREELGQRMRNEYANSNGVANIGNANTAPITGSVPNRAELGQRMRNAYANNNAYAPTEVPAAKPSNNEWVNERHSKIDSIKSDADSGKITPLEAKKRLNRVMASARLKHGISDSDRADIRNHAIQANNAIEHNNNPKNDAAEHTRNNAANNRTNAANNIKSKKEDTKPKKETAKPKEAQKEAPKEVPKEAPKVEPKKASKPKVEQNESPDTKETPKVAQKPKVEQKPKAKRTESEIIDDTADKAMKVVNLFQKGLITIGEAHRKLVEVISAGSKNVNNESAKKGLDDVKRSAMDKIGSQYTKNTVGEERLETYRKAAFARAVDTINSPKFSAFNKKAKEILGDKLYENIYIPTLSQILAGSRGVKTSAGESALLFSKMVQSFHDNYGIDVYPLEIYAERGKRRLTHTIMVNGRKYKSSIIGTYLPGTNSIELSSQASKETFMHEASHFYMEMLRNYSFLTDTEISKYFNGDKEAAQKAVQKIRKDFATIEKWASYDKGQLEEYKGTKLEAEFTQRAQKIEKGDESERKAWADERFARGFEQYLADGKSPTKELESVFKRFKKWLLDIYNGITGLHKAELTPEIRRFYDSMINGTANEETMAGKPSAEAKPKRKKFKEETVRTDNGKEFKVTYRVMEADDVISSNTADFAPDNRYPPQLQPRDRSRKTMKEQVDGMSRNLSPSDLAGSRNVNEGAPIINGDKVVENGNGRTMAIKRAYALEGKGYEDSAKAYKNYLIEHAEEYGYTPEEIKEMKNPILVRERSSESDGLQKDIIHSTAGGMEMSSSQRAKADAEKITPQITRLYNYDGSGDLTLESNREFVATVLNTIASKNEKDRLFDSDGNPSKEGIERVKNAMTAAAYENNELIDRMGESTDDDMRNVVKAYAAVSPRVASVAKRIETGDVLESYDLPKVLSDALSIYFKCKGNKKAIQNELDTPSLFGGDKVSAPVKEFVMFMADNTRKPRAISDAISRMVDYVDGANEKSADLWEGTRRTLDECVDAAIHESPKYLITNKNLKATDKVQVVNLVGETYHGPLGKFSNSLCKALKDCTFKISNEGINLRFFNRDDRSHFTYGNKHGRAKKARLHTLSDESNIKNVLENSVYIEEEENYHDGNSPYHFVQFMSVVKDGDRFIRLRISAKKLADGTFDVKDVGLYNITTFGNVDSLHIKKGRASPTSSQRLGDNLQEAGVPSYTVSVADALTGVKDRKGRRKCQVFLGNSFDCR
nr:MAG TPA: crystallin beta/gamma motif-containing protein [Caudoviricetes sp.]